MLVRVFGVVGGVRSFCGAFWVVARVFCVAVYAVVYVLLQDSCLMQCF